MRHPSRGLLLELGVNLLGPWLVYGLCRFGAAPRRCRAQRRLAKTPSSIASQPMPVCCSARSSRPSVSSTA